MLKCIFTLFVGFFSVLVLAQNNDNPWTADKYSRPSWVIGSWGQGLSEVGASLDNIGYTTVHHHQADGTLFVTKNGRKTAEGHWSYAESTNTFCYKFTFLDGRGNTLCGKLLDKIIRSNSTDVVVFSMKRQKTENQQIVFVKVPSNN